MTRYSGNKAFTYAEVLVTLSVSILLFGAVLGLFVTSKQFYTVNILGESLQRDANKVMAKIIKGKIEPGGIYRLSDAAAYNLVALSELHFWGQDGTERWIRLSGDGRSVIYHHPTSNGQQDEILYTTPDGVALTLRFWVPPGPLYAGVNIALDVGLSRDLRGRTFNGSATTIVNIRNHA